ncbi:hypothetical protein [Thermoactinospora rubra]|uniref:hypothetical protein n=1 Tax=Thermoactinospora rubra TaxID=1088767 RepID=UPI000A11F1D3|nr:hypothetical protein [Thermoactinospora rubra]
MLVEQVLDAAADLQPAPVQPGTASSARTTGRLLIARAGGEEGQVVGTGALKPVDATTGEIKALYRSLGFTEIPIFDHTEAGLSNLEPFMIFMGLSLGQATRL